MSFKRYVGNTSKETMAQARRDLGDEAVILSNRRLPNGQIEILVAAAGEVDAIVADVRRPKAAPRTSVPAVQTFQDYLRRQSQPPVRTGASGNGGANHAAAMYSTVAAAPDDDADDGGWANSRFDPSLMGGGTRPAAATGARSTRTAAPPTWDTQLPNAARSTVAPRSAEPRASARPATISAPPPEPAVFRRRPSREGAALAASDAQRYPAMQPANQALAQPAAPLPPPLASMPQQTAPAALPLAAQRALSAAPATPMPAGVASPTLAQPVPPAAQQPPVQTNLPSPVQPLTAPVPTPQAITPAGAPVVGAAALPPSAQVIAHPALAAAAVAGASAARAAPAAAAAAPTDSRLPPAAAAQPGAQLMAELHSLRAALQEQLSALSTTVTASDVTRRHPLQTRLMTRLLTAGFSIDVARRIALNAPTQGDAAAADAWLQDVLTLNLRCAAADDGIVERAGAGGCNVYALVGPTGVGKTTTVAKLAARFAVRYGANALGLITLDGYRIAAHEQLRSYGRILGTPVHLAQDGATLRELLASMKGKQLVLIDTCGVGPRDARLPEMLDMLAQAGSGEQKVRPVLLLNAASHAETLEETARAWRAGAAAGTLLTKLDEAARIGGALDCALRHKLTLFGLTNGQRVPEDLHAANARLLAHLALKPASQLFALADGEGALLGQSPRASQHA